MDTKKANTIGERWLEDYGDYLFRYALTRVNHTQAAEDLVQETLLSALKAKDSFDGRSSARTWLTTILRNKIIDYYRKTTAQTATYLNTSGETNLEPEFDEHGRWIPERAPKDWGAPTEAIFEQNEFLRILKACLEVLADLTARVFMLKEMDGVDSKSICQALDISPSNLWVILHRARKSLRRCIEKNWLG